MISIEARGSLLLHKGGLGGVPDQKRVVLTVPNEHPELMGDGSLGGSTSHLSLNLPLLKYPCLGHSSSSDDSAFGVQNFRFASRQDTEPVTSLQRPMSARPTYHQPIDVLFLVFLFICDCTMLLVEFPLLVVA